MAITQTTNSKANVKKPTTNDLPFQPAFPITSYYSAVSTLGQTTVANLGFTVDTTLNVPGLVIVDGKILTRGTGNDFDFSAVAADGTSSSILFNITLPAGLNIQVVKLGAKKESEFQTDNRFTQLYEAQGQAFQGFINTSSAVVIPTASTGTPAAGTFYTSISNRASMPDPSQNLRAQMGVDRIITQQLTLTANESGPASEAVYLAANDTAGQVRFIGNWNSTTTANGNVITSTTTGDSVEVTFFGTGLNILDLAFSNAVYSDLAVTVDGVAGTNLTNPAGQSTILNARNYTTNRVRNVVTGLSLGIHTVKMTLLTATTVGQSISGFEIVNSTASNVVISSGISYNQGKKVVAAGQTQLAYNSVVTGTRGGRVLVYQKADGTIGQSFQPTNSSTALLNSADHTNEEVVRSYNWREFGAGRADDFSSIAYIGAGKTFTIDDDSTTLIASSVYSHADGSLAPFSNGGFFQFQFVGTGLDVVVADNASGGSDSYTYQIDGGTATAWSNTAGNTTLRIQRVVSGLPYGQHTFRFNRVTATTWEPGFRNFIVYQPKKPTLPAGATELADYNVLANFTPATTALTESVSTGVLRKVTNREMFLSGTWTATQTINSGGGTAPVGGTYINTTTANSYVQYTFFGTGFDFRFGTSSTTQLNVTVSVDGNSNLTSLGASTGFYGSVTSFTASTGVIVGNIQNTFANGAYVTGLPLGVHTVRVTYNTGATFPVEAFDIITPVHSQKSNIYIDAQNSLPVGSQGISDNRKTSAVKDSSAIPKAYAIANGVLSAPTTTATASSPVPVPDMNVTIKTSGGALDITAYIDFANNTTGAGSTFGIYVDGVAVSLPSNTDVSPGTAGQNMSWTKRVIVPVSAGAHNVQMYWGVYSGTLTALLTDRNLVVKEL
jgi:hypothetical protein